MTGVILAAGGASDFAGAYGVPTKALIPVAGRPLVTYVVEALRAAHGLCDLVIIRSPESLLPESATLGVPQVPAAGTRFRDSIVAAAEAAKNDPLCIVTADLPALTPRSIDATINFALDSGADLTYTIVEADAVARAFPGSTRTTVRLKEGRFTGGNAVVVRVETLLTSLARIERAFGRRKSIIGLTMLLGPLFLWRLARGRLSVEEAAARGATILGCRVAVYVSPYPEIGFDVDKPSDLEVAEKVLSRSQSSQTSQG